MLRPSYQIFKIALSSTGVLPSGSTTGQQDIRALATKFIFIGAQDASGNQVLDAQLSVQLGFEGIGDPIPLGVNSKITAPCDFWRITWNVQPGYTAVILIGDSPENVDALDVAAPPARQLVTSSAGTQLQTQQTTVGTSAAQLVAASTTRQSATIRNRGQGTVYLGGSAVTTTTGFALDPGETFTFSGTTAAIFAIASVAGTPVHTIQEA